MSIENEPSPEEMGLESNNDEGILSESDVESKTEQVFINREQAVAGQELVNYFSGRLKDVSREINELHEEKLKLEDQGGSADNINLLTKKIEDLRAYEVFAKKKVRDGEERRDKFDAFSKKGMTPEVEAELYKEAQLNKATIDIDMIDNRKPASPETKLDKITTDLKRAAAVLAVLVTIGPTASKAQEEKGLDLVWKNFISMVKPETTDYAKGLIKQGIEYHKIKDQWALLQELSRDTTSLQSEMNSLEKLTTTDYKSLERTKGGRGRRSELHKWMEDLLEEINELNERFGAINSKYSKVDSRVINVTEIQAMVSEQHERFEQAVKGLNSNFRIMDVLPAIDPQQK